jgi:predicted Zn finger-like uncharacterized protein
MIAICPACGKRYRVADAAVPVTGREVRCAACRRGWTVWPDGVTPPVPTIVADLPPPMIDAAVAPVAVAVVASAPPEPPPPPLVTPLPEAATTSTWSPDPEPKPRRRYGLIITIALVAVAVTAAAVVEFAPAETFDPPRLGLLSPHDLVRQMPTLSLPPFDLPPLDLRRVPLVGEALDGVVNPPSAPASPLIVSAHGERRILANGTNVLMVSGSVANPTAAPVALTGIDAVLRDPAGHVAIRWRIAAPVAAVAANSSAAFESVAANFPATATVLQLTPR